MPHEPTVRQAIEAGADLVTFSGDKLLGGPQAGLIVGRADLISKSAATRSSARCGGKLTLAALEPVLALYRSPNCCPRRLSALRLMLRPQAAMQARPRLDPLSRRWGRNGTWRMRDEQPDRQRRDAVESLPSWACAGAGKAGSGRALARLAAALRGLPRPVVGRIGDDALWLDLRCLEAADEVAFIDQLGSLRT